MHCQAAHIDTPSSTGQHPVGPQHALLAVNLHRIIVIHQWGFPGGSAVKNPPAIDSVPGWGWSPGEENGYPLQYSCPGNPIDRGTWQATVHEVAKSRHDWATNWTTTIHSETLATLNIQMLGILIHFLPVSSCDKQKKNPQGSPHVCPQNLWLCYPMVQATVCWAILLAVGSLPRSPWPRPALPSSRPAQPVLTAHWWASRRQGRKWVLKHSWSRLGAGQGADICLQEWPAPHSFYTRMISDVDAVPGFDHGWLKRLQQMALDLVPKTVNLTWHAVGCRKQPWMEPFRGAPLLQAPPEGGLFYERVAHSRGWMQALLRSSGSPICWSQSLLMDPVQNVYSPRWPLSKVSRGWLCSQRDFASSSPR